MSSRDPSRSSRFITPPRTFTADGESAVIRVRTEDQFGNPAPVGGDQDIDLELERRQAGGFRISAERISSRRAWSYRVGRGYGFALLSGYGRRGKTITASASGQSWTDAQQAITVDPGSSLQARGVSRRYDGHRGGFCEVPARGRGRRGEREPAPQQPGDFAPRAAGGFLFDVQPYDADHVASS